MGRYRKRTRQYAPPLAKPESPRVSASQRAAVGAICRKRRMHEAEVLRYGLDAVILAVSNGKFALQWLSHNEMYHEGLNIRLSRDVRPLLDKLGERPHRPTRNQVLRACIDTMILKEQKHGFAWLLTLREKFISRRHAARAGR